jgi:5'-phosphate synthase pdxT subunit
VLAVQGAFAEHARVLEALLGHEGEVVEVRRPEDIETADGFVLPGGESTTIEKLLDAGQLRAPLARRVDDGAPTLATCAGAILLASEGADEVDQSDTELIGALDASIERNAFGRQRESFEAEVDVAGLDEPFPGVFIRAPAFRETWGRAEPWARLPNGRLVGVEQGNLLAASFHPELSGDPRVHRRFLARFEAAPDPSAEAPP